MPPALLTVATPGLIPDGPAFGTPDGAVLVVDPSDLTHALVRGVLRRNGYRTLHAHSTAEAIELIRTEAIAAVVTESVDEMVDGFDLAAELRTHLRQRRVPVVIYTARYTAVDDVRLSSLQPAIVLPKDGDVAALATAVTTALRLTVA